MALTPREDDDVVQRRAAHAHVFERYDAINDLWVCRCGGAVRSSLGIVTVAVGLEPEDLGVRSGRERLTC